MKHTGKFAFSLQEDDYFIGRYDTIEDAFSDAIDNAELENEYLDDEEKIDIVYAGELMEFVPYIDAERVIEYIQCQADDEVGEYSYDYLDDVNKDDIKKLEKALTDAFNKWAKETNNEPDLFMVEDIKERKITKG